jgi:hypothetical protein
MRKETGSRMFPVMFRFALLAVVLPAVLQAQRAIRPDTNNGRRVIEEFDRALAGSTAESLDCRVQVGKPRLTYSFRHLATYEAAVPVSELDPAGTVLTTMFRVTPKQGGQPGYFRQTLRIGKIPAKVNSKFLAVADGGFFVGEGEYQVDWLLRDHRGRACRKEWSVKVRAKDKDRPQPLAPGTVTSVQLDQWGETASRENRPFRVALMLHAAPTRLLGHTLTRVDQSLLVGMLISLLEETPFVETSVTAFNLNQQKELFHTERLDMKEFTKLADCLDELELGTIDLQVLERPTGDVELLANMLKRELKSPDPPDAVVFVGPKFLDESNVSESILDVVSEPKPLVFYLRQDYYPRLFIQDTIEKLTKRLKGKVFRVSSPEELAKAIREMEERLKERRAALHPAGPSGE